MAVIKLILTDEEKLDLKNRAKANGVTLQSYIHSALFKKKSIYSASSAFQRATDPVFMEKYKDKSFELRDLYTDEEWSVMTTGTAGALGRQFFAQINDVHPGIIEHVSGGRNGQRAKYKFV